jgi:uncharacterized membrane protein (GlpM family)
MKIKLRSPPRRLAVVDAIILGGAFLLALVCSTRSMHTLDTKLFNRLIINKYVVYLFVRLFYFIYPTREASRIVCATLVISNARDFSTCM